MGDDKGQYTSSIRTGRVSNRPLENDQEAQEKNTEELCAPGLKPVGWPNLHPVVITLEQSKCISLLYKTEK